MLVFSVVVYVIGLCLMVTKVRTYLRSFENILKVISEYADKIPIDLLSKMIYYVQIHKL